jgi:multidrug efflux pump subunit AcrA (membrane-fusion protein)
MPIEIDLANPGGRIRHGMFAKATIYLEKAVPTLSIPRDCLIGRSEESKGSVYVVRDGKAHRVNVKLGMNDGVRAEVLHGLTKDDHVILAPPSTLADGDEVEVAMLDEGKESGD